MRYTRLKTTISRIYDGILDDPEDIRNILVSLKDKEVTCSIKLKSGLMGNPVRILEVNDNDSFKWMMMKQRASLRRTSKFDDIDTLEVNTCDEITVKKREASRWSILDPTSSLEE